MFDDIKIDGIDKERSRPIEADSQASYVCFKLSAVPPAEWVEILKAGWLASLFVFVSLEDQYLTVSCPTDPSVRGCETYAEDRVSRANRSYRRCLDDLEQQAPARKAQEEQRRAALDQRRQKLWDAIDARDPDD